MALSRGRHRLVEASDLSLEDECGSPGDDTAGAGGSVTKAGGDLEQALLADARAHQAWTNEQARGSGVK
jgi:hypothetical protein